MQDRQKILIVDDKKENLYLLEKILSETGAEIIKATSGNDALKATLSHEFALAILDVQMPGMDGYELAEFIRAEERTRHVPIIFMSAVYSDDYYVFKGYDAGGVDYIVKPYNPTVLLSKVSVFLQLHRQQTELLKHREHLEEQVKQRTVELQKEITERKRAEETLRESEEKYRLLVGNATDAIFVAQDEVIKFPNPRTEELVGYSAEELATIRFTDLIHPDDRDMVLDRHRRKLKGESLPTTYSFRIINRAGEELWTQLNTVAITWEGRPATLHFLRDITPQRKLEAQLQQSQKMEAIGTLAGGVAHDFNNLLTTIIGCSDLMMMRIGKDHELRENLEDIRKAGDRAASLTRQLLAFSRRQILEPKVIDLNDVIPDMDKMLRRLIGEDIDLETVLAPGLGRVEADPGQVEQIIMNLAVNARDAMPRGGKLTMETANVDLDEAYARSHVAVTPGPYVMMAISDSGTGMDEETLSKAFDPFFTTKEAGRGTGLGLSTVYGIVKQSKGNIWAYSEPGKGTTFKIYLPRVEKDAVEKEEVEATAESLTGSETILVVEDNEMVRGLAQTILQHYGYSVLAAQDGEEAIKVSKEHDGPIDLMLTDVVMPKMSGKEVAERLNALRPDMKVLYMSGYTGNAIVHHGVLDREMRFIQKPFTTESLARKVREVLD